VQRSEFDVVRSRVRDVGGLACLGQDAETGRRETGIEEGALGQRHGHIRWAQSLPARTGRKASARGVQTRGEEAYRWRLALGPRGRRSSGTGEVRCGGAGPRSRRCGASGSRRAPTRLAGDETAGTRAGRVCGPMTARQQQPWGAARPPSRIELLLSRHGPTWNARQRLDKGHGSTRAAAQHRSTADGSTASTPSTASTASTASTPSTKHTKYQAPSTKHQAPSTAASTTASTTAPPHHRTTPPGCCCCRADPFLPSPYPAATLSEPPANRSTRRRPDRRSHRRTQRESKRFRAYAQPTASFPAPRCLHLLSRVLLRVHTEPRHQRPAPTCARQPQPISHTMSAMFPETHVSIDPTATHTVA
jgi:hypothetical protein